MTNYDDVANRFVHFGYEVQEVEKPALLFLIEKVKQEIFVFCNIIEIPSELEPLLIDKVCGEYLQQLHQIGKLGENFSFEKELKAITEGDSSFTFADDDSAEMKFKRFTSWLIGHNDWMLIEFRKLRW